MCGSKDQGASLRLRSVVGATSWPRYGQEDIVIRQSPQIVILFKYAAIGHESCAYNRPCTHVLIHSHLRAGEQRSTTYDPTASGES